MVYEQFAKAAEKAESAKEVEKKPGRTLAEILDKNNPDPNEQDQFGELLKSNGQAELAKKLFLTDEVPTPEDFDTLNKFHKDFLGKKEQIVEIRNGIDQKLMNQMIAGSAALQQISKLIPPDRILAAVSRHIEDVAMSDSKTFEGVRAALKKLQGHVEGDHKHTDWALEETLRDAGVKEEDFQKAIQEPDPAKMESALQSAVEHSYGLNFYKMAVTAWTAGKGSEGFNIPYLGTVGKFKGSKEWAKELSGKKDVLGQMGEDLRTHINGLGVELAQTLRGNEKMRAAMAVKLKGEPPEQIERPAHFSVFRGKIGTEDEHLEGWKEYKKGKSVNDALKQAYNETYKQKVKERVGPVKGLMAWLIMLFMDKQFGASNTELMKKMA